jgi:multidrug efflux pump subunit AcrA (membrane-fusion protein)
MNTASAILRQKDLHEALAAVSGRILAPRRSPWKRVLVGAAAVVLVAVAALALPSLNSAWHASAVEAVLPQSSLRSISVVRPSSEAVQSELVLPAEVQAYQTTAIHARIGGYLKSWKVDRGARVTAGQVLAEIDAPEFDQQLRQSRSELDEGRAALAQARAERDQALANLTSTRAEVLKADANLELALKTMDRFKNLEEKWAASRQQYDETVRNHEASKAELAAAKANVGSFEAAVATREAAIRTAEARVNSLLANVHRLEELEGFKTLTAPFDGIITRRGLDVGALVPTDGSRELFTIAQDDTLRVTANVPQAYAAMVHEGQKAEVLAREFTDRILTAKVARTAGSIDTGARTLTIELELPNAEHTLLPGAFTQIRFEVQNKETMLRIPTSTLRFTRTGTQVVIVDKEQKLQPLPVKLGRDYGTSVEVLTGLKGGEELVVNPTDSMATGEQVKVADEKNETIAAK